MSVLNTSSREFNLETLKRVQLNCEMSRLHDALDMLQTYYDPIIHSDPDLIRIFTRLCDRCAYLVGDQFVNFYEWHDEELYAVGWEKKEDIYKK